MPGLLPYFTEERSRNQSREAEEKSNETPSWGLAAPIACVSANFFFIVVLAVVAVEVDGRAVA